MVELSYLGIFKVTRWSLYITVNQKHCTGCYSYWGKPRCSTVLKDGAWRWLTKTCISRMYTYHIYVYSIMIQIARFMGPTWGPPGDDRTQVGPMMAPWTLLSGEQRSSFVALCFNHMMQQDTLNHYGDVLMGAIMSQITRLTIVYSTVYSDEDQRKHHSSASLAFVRGIHRRPGYSLHKWPVTRKMLLFDDVIICI